MITRSSRLEVGGASPAMFVTPAILTGRPVNSTAGPVEICVQIARDLRGQAGHPLELLARGVEHRVGRAEVRQQRLLALRPDAGQAVEDRLRHLFVAALAVVRDGEAVRLVADALQELE